MTAGPWTRSSAVDSGIPVQFSDLVPERTFWHLGGRILVRDKQNLDWLIAALNRLQKRFSRGPTKAMLGNQRRRELMAQIRARTFGPY